MDKSTCKFLVGFSIGIGVATTVAYLSTTQNESVKEKRDKYVNEGKKVVEDIKTNVEYTLEESKEDINGINDSIKKGVKNTEIKAEDVALKVKDKVSDKTDKAIKKEEDKAKVKKQKIDDKLEDKKGKLETSKDKVNKVTEEVTDFLDSSQIKVEDKTNELSDKVKEDIDKTTNKE